MSSTADGPDALRKAAERRAWNECREATERLLCRLAPAEAFRFAVAQVAKRIPGFERYPPGASWPRERLGNILEAAETGPSSDWPSELPEAVEEYPGPGANNFVLALSALWDAVGASGDPQRRTALLVEAIAGAIMAGMIEHWGARHPDAWRSWLQAAAKVRSGRESNGEETQLRVLRSMMDDPEVAKIDTAAWLDVADELERLLSSRG
jgi:hypothetical protein